ncbi:NKG2-A/NKG2-B type II integral membrane protein [Portunus trituberculatus]|uniref:NKG2-A/NKG2-B type II integral membrane protein n=1 Tax=Portunus trituberculatus TaxID=210409 RepID=A0A5B7EVP8_PORTR|nr:NKG2-A/NKG2-B type II integral membrane protein [Portunus trituberculatus]
MHRTKRLLEDTGGHYCRYIKAEECVDSVSSQDGEAALCSAGRPGGALRANVWYGSQVVFGSVVDGIKRQETTLECGDVLKLDFTDIIPTVHCSLPCPDMNNKESNDTEFSDTVDLLDKSVRLIVPPQTIAVGPVFKREARLDEYGLMVRQEYGENGTVTCLLVDVISDSLALQSSLQAEACDSVPPFTEGSTVSSTAATEGSTLSTTTVTGGSSVSTTTGSESSTVSPTTATEGSTVSTTTATEGSTVSPTSATEGSTVSTTTATEGSTVSPTTATEGSTVSPTTVTGGLSADTTIIADCADNMDTTESVSGDEQSQHITNPSSSVTTPSTTSLPTTTTTTPRYKCPSDFESFNNSCYHVSVEEGTWEDGRIYCALKNSKYVTITNDDEFYYVISLLSTDTWIGLNDRENEGFFIWDSDGTAFDYEIIQNRLLSCPALPLLGPHREYSMT